MTAAALAIAELPNAEWNRKFRRALTTWYRKSKRDLPWRHTRDAYCIWVSEIMLQQTQVATVIPYYKRFLQRFPDVKSLASADESEVLRHWEGLGYYRRARQLYAASKVIVDEHRGEFPRDFEDILALPGVGRYTAGAIASFAYDQRRPALEANTIRLFTRLLAYEGDPTKAAGRNLLWAAAEHVLPKRNVAEVNQALMELGSLICQPSNPQCEVCPVARICVARERGLERALPTATKKLNYEDRREAAVVIWNRGRLLMRECQEGERWAGLWDFPRFHVTAKSPGEKKQIQQLLKEMTGHRVALGQKLTSIRHGVTRFRIELCCYQAAFVSIPRRLKRPLKWVREGELDEFPLSVTGRKILRFLAKQKQD